MINYVSIDSQTDRYPEHTCVARKRKGHTSLTIVSVYIFQGDALGICHDQHLTHIEKTMTTSFIISLMSRYDPIYNENITNMLIVISRLCV